MINDKWFHKSQIIMMIYSWIILIGKSMLHWTVEFKRAKALEALLKSGADVNLKDKNGE